MRPKTLLKKTATFTGRILGILGLTYVIYSLFQTYTLSTFTQQFAQLAPLLPLLFLLNLLSVLIGIYVWHLILLHYAQRHLAFLFSYYYFSKTEIAKYLPGNIFHLVGRQALASKIGISQVEMAKISLLFSFLLLAATIISSSFFALLSQEIPAIILTLMGISSIITLIILIYIYPSFPVFKKVSINIYLALSVALQGTMLGIIIMYQSENFSIHLFFQCMSIYILSWLIGFITPGASGGLGVREGSFIAMATYLHLDISSDMILFSVLLVRLMNICVDVTLYLSTVIVEKKMKEQNI